MGQELRAVTAFAKDLNWNPSTYVAALNPPVITPPADPKLPSNHSVGSYGFTFSGEGGREDSDSCKPYLLFMVSNSPK